MMPDKVTVIMTIKKLGAILLAAVIVSGDYLSSALSRHILQRPPTDTAQPPLNFIVDYLPDCGDGEQLSCIK